MAVDDKPGDEESDVAEGPARPRRRGGSSLLQQAKTPVNVESSLEAFIERTKEGPHLDVSSFDPANREAALIKQVEALQAKLDAAEARATAAGAEARAAEARAVAALARKPRRWGGLIAAFVVGGAAMFAISLAIPREKPLPETSPAVAVPAAVPDSTPTVIPLATSPTPAPVPPPPEAPPSADQTAAVAVPDRAAARASSDGVTKKPPSKRAPKQPAPTPATPADPPPAKSSTQEELYNPF